MDILAHGLWTNLAYRKKYKTNIKNRLWAVFFGIMPDLISFTPATLYLFFYHGSSRFWTMSSSNVWAFNWASYSYNYTHSLITFLAVTAIVLVIRKGKMYWPLLGWVLHIVIDIFTHPDFYSTPFLYPLSNFKNHYGISWGNPYFMAINYGVMAIFYLAVFISWRRKKQGYEQK